MSYIRAARVARALPVAAFTATVVASTPALAASQHLGQRTLSPGMRGHDVRVLQDFLTRSGFRTPITGYFGSITENHVKRFERRNHMSVDGVVGPVFVQRIRSVVARKEGATPTTSSRTTTGTETTRTATATQTGGTGFGPGPNNGPVEKATLNSQGLAVPPPDAPAVIRDVIAAANKIAFKPYIYGGGHQSFNSRGYDCSGSVSYALHGGGLLNSPLDSSEFETWGRGGAGRWMTLWTNSGHVYMYIAGLRFDTGAQSSSNSNDRWSTQSRSHSGYIERHPAGW